MMFGRQEFKIKGTAWSVSDESSLPGLQIATFLPCAHMAFSGVGATGERERDSN